MNESEQGHAPSDRSLNALSRDLTGLSSAEAASRRVKSIRSTSPLSSVLRLLLSQFLSPIILVLIAAALVAVLIGDAVEGLIILSIIFASGILGFIQEWRAAVAMEELVGATEIQANVVRDGREIEIVLDEVVRGDLVVLRAGDFIPADLTILTSERLLVDESTITGESIAREKIPVEPSSQSDALVTADGELSPHRLYFGSHVVSGTAMARTDAVGAETTFGALVEKASRRDIRTHFEQEMTAFGVMLTRVIVVLVLAVFATSVVLDRPVVESLMFALAIGVGVTPQLLPAITSVSLAFGARAMSSAKVLVKRLDAVEDIGGMSILCCDKTGTLTEGVLALEEAVDAFGQQSTAVLELAGLNAGLQKGYPNDLDQAIIHAAGVPRARALDELPYDFERRRLSVLVRREDEALLVTKGAVTSVLEVSASVREGDALRPFDPSVRATLMDRFRRYSESGFRVLGLASLPMPSRESLELADESGLVFEGFLIFSDPVLPSARQSVADLLGLGVDVALITGDNPHIARHVAREVGLASESVVTGDEVEALTEEQLRELVTRTRVFAQMNPLQKERVVNALQSHDLTVGFLGDGINDAAALRSADVGISVESAADAAKHAASLVVLTKNLDVITDGIRLGRKTLSNTVKYIRVTISANFGNMVSLVVASAFLPFLPLMPMQILLLNLLSDVPALTLASDNVDSSEVQSPRRWSLPQLRRFMIWFGLASSVIDISAFLVLYYVLGVTEAGFHSAWFVLSLVTECLILLVLRSARPMWKSAPRRSLLIASLVVVTSGVVMPFTLLGNLMGFRPIPALILGVLVLLCLVYVGLNEALKRRWNRGSGAWVV